MERDSPDKNQDPSAQHNGLTRAVLETLVLGQGPLSMDELRTVEGGPMIMKSEEFRMLFSAVGWPNHLEDGAIRPSRQYDDESFRAALTREYSIDGISLNNFPLRLSANKAELHQTAGKVELHSNETSFADNMYGGLPYVLRAYALAPAFMQSLHERVRCSDGKSAEFIARDPELAQNAHMAYRLLGRLMKITDNETYFRLKGYDVAGSELIDDAHVQLTA
jgi:hypothetical protein